MPVVSFMEANTDYYQNNKDNFNIEKQNNNIYNNNTMSDTNNHDNVGNDKLKNDRIAAAEAEMYFDSSVSVNPGHFNSEDLGDCTKETFQYHRQSEPFDNNSYVTDQVIDSRIIKNHADWVSEITPWAGTASIVGQNDFNPGDYINFQGLRRPRSVKQDNPYFITEIDESNLENNKPFMI